ncbi:MAG: alpha/beta hydrolase [Melioribacteraceae bacterium]|nr:alpha/beta hydrolase [Melioribacteraceae bacterium]
MKFYIHLYLLLILFLPPKELFSQNSNIEKAISIFEKNYEERLDDVHIEINNDSLSGISEVKIVSGKLRTDNYPTIYHYNKITKNVIVLIHGLSDSPYYLKDIAKRFVSDSANVVLVLLPGHGLKDPDLAMEDDSLKTKWRKEVFNAVEVAGLLGRKISIGGFSTGGALSIDYILNNPKKINGGLFLFSAALGLGGWTEFNASIPLVSSIVAKYNDGLYRGESENPYKYPKVADYSGIHLVDIIKDIREKNSDVKVKLPIFIAHCKHDKTAKWENVNQFYSNNGTAKFLYEINDTLVKHGNLVLEKNIVNKGKIIVKKNPVFNEMMEQLIKFYRVNIK